ncbi:apolipoprotein L2 isoform X2 [Symphalangus syndactylus]|uniref:apolipoprotein L2 isoform X2 n=2 Tax=Symphalangus syndactylus TaxID=9590 RepID=UPI0024423DF9|nr:apolipoprotein L2-like isoform X1 [Symphalangus syndactylus]
MRFKRHTMELRRPRSDMDGAALLRVFVLYIWTSALFLGVGVRAEEAGVRVQQNVPSGTVTDTGNPQGKPLGDYAAGSMDPESSIFIEDAIKYFQEKVSTQNLLLLLTDDEAWNGFVAAAELTRDEADEFHKALNKLARHVIMKDKNWHDKDQQHRKWFLKEFPHLKRELQDHIIRLHVLADGVEQVHRGTTITNVVSSTAGVISDILTLIGIGLAPFTEGISLGLSETGMGMGIAAAVTGIASNAVEQAKKLWAQAQAGNLDQRESDVAKVIKEFMGENTPNFLSLIDNSYQVIQGIGKDIRAIRQARSNSQLEPSATPLEIIGQISAESDEEVGRVTESPTLEMSRGTKIVGVATGGILLVLDVVSLVYESKHLHEGAKSESAEELKKQAQELEGKLNILTKIHEILQADQEL